MSVPTRLSECTNSSPTGRIMVEFDIRDFHQYLSSWFKFGKKKIGQKQLAFYTDTSVRLQCWQQYEIFCSSTVVQRAFASQQQAHLCCWQLDVRQKIRWKRRVTFPSQQLWRQRVTTLHYAYNAYIVKTKLHKLSKNLGVTSQFLGPEDWYEAKSMLRIHQLRATLQNPVATAIWRPRFVQPCVETTMLMSGRILNL